MPQKTTSSFKLFSKLLKNNSKFVVAGHASPDGDVIGSTLAMMWGLKGLGKKALAFNNDGCPQTLKFLPGSELIQNEIPKNMQDAVLITVDSGDIERLGDKITQYPFKEVWVVDHHKSNTRFGKYNFINIKAGSTGQVVYDLLSTCRGFKLNQKIAQNIFCTLSTDTGSFKYSNSTPDVFNLAAKLVDAGAKPDVISTALYETYPQRRLLLLEKVLGSLKFEMDGKLASLVLTNQDLHSVGATSEDSDEFVNFPRGVSGVKVVCFIKEKTPTEWKLSLRSRDNVNVLSIAKKFNGGGHELAAGCTIKGKTLTEIQADLKNVITELGVF